MTGPAPLTPGGSFLSKDYTGVIRTPMGSAPLTTAEA